MGLHEYASLMGRVVINLQSLEFALRGFLCNSEAPPHNPLPSRAGLDGLGPGDVVPVNAFTDFDSLGRLIERYNSLDALTHGRISTTDPSKDLFLVKFDRPIRNTTRVNYAQKVTTEWLKAKIDDVHTELMKVAKVAGESEA
jgi:hypothetical protein